MNDKLKNDINKPNNPQELTSMGPQDPPPKDPLADTPPPKQQPKMPPAALPESHTGAQKKEKPAG